MSLNLFTPEEIAYIDKKLHSVIFDWAKTLIIHIIGQAQDKGVELVYMNTVETLEAGSITKAKALYFYDKLPPTLGFKKERATLRNKGQETLWALHLNEITASFKNALLKIARQFTFSEIPQKYQGAFISILGRKDFYTDLEARKVLEMLEKKQNKPKTISKFYYDWGSKTWSGGQSFKHNVTENVVLQKLTSEMQNMIAGDRILTKFWGYALSHHQHFGSDVIGFALVSKISSKIWVINEVQSDCLSHYLELRSQALKWKETQKTKKTFDWETIKDMLVAQNRSKWVPIIEINESLKNQIINSPDMIVRLPDDTHNIDDWIQKLKAEKGGPNIDPDLIRHFQSVNFNSKIFRTY